MATTVNLGTAAVNLTGTNAQLIAALIAYWHTVGTFKGQTDCKSASEVWRHRWIKFLDRVPDQ